MKLLADSLVLYPVVRSLFGLETWWSRYLLETLSSCHFTTTPTQSIISCLHFHTTTFIYNNSFLLKMKSHEKTNFHVFEHFLFMNRQINFASFANSSILNKSLIVTGADIYLCFHPLSALETMYLSSNHFTSFIHMFG